MGSCCSTATPTRRQQQPHIVLSPPCHVRHPARKESTGAATTTWTPQHISARRIPPIVETPPSTFSIREPPTDGDVLCGYSDSIRLLPITASERRHGGVDGVVLRYKLTITSIKLCDLKSCTQIGLGFCSNLSSLRTLELTGLVNCRYISQSFCKRCTALESVQLSNMMQCAVISDDGCTSLKSLELEMDCQKLGKRFCHGCSALTSLDLSGMRRCAEIGSKFFGGSTSLATLNISSMGADVPKIGGTRMPITLDQLNSIKSLKVVVAGGMLAAFLEQQGTRRFELMVGVWSWRNHHLCSLSTRMAVLCIFQGITFADSCGEEYYLPSEVAFEICSYIHA